MKRTLLLPLLCLSVLTFAQEPGSADGSGGPAKKGLEASLGFSLHSNGIAPIPSFSLDKPALAVEASVARGRFSYDPALFYSLDMKPWFIDNWFHYRIVDREVFDLTAGINFSTFCAGMSVDGEEILKAERYFAGSLSATWQLGAKSFLTADYWSDNGQEKGTVSGHFLALAYDLSDLALGAKGLLSFHFLAFYINYTGNNDGLFLSPSATLTGRDLPVSLFLQATQPLQTNIDPSPGFKWNVGIRYDM
ncbi:MAG: hypothetical protein R2751_07125 [Bacteroidales bacterium]